MEFSKREKRKKKIQNKKNLPKNKNKIKENLERKI